MKKLIIGLVVLLSSCANATEFHYQDCVEITGGFYHNDHEQIVGRVFDERQTFKIKEYRVGDILFGIWINEKDLKLVDKKVCEEAEKAN